MFDHELSLKRSEFFETVLEAKVTLARGEKTQPLRAKGVNEVNPKRAKNGNGGDGCNGMGQKYSFRTHVV